MLAVNFTFIVSHLAKLQAYHIILWSLIGDIVKLRENGGQTCFKHFTTAYIKLYDFLCIWLSTKPIKFG